MLWGEQNGVVHRRAQDAPILLEYVVLWLREYQGLHKTYVNGKEGNSKVPRWIKLIGNDLKLNVDVAIGSNSIWIGIGAVICDSNGAMQGVMAHRMRCSFGAYMGECLALREGIKFVVDYGFQIDQVESDSQKAILARVFNHLH